jgi:hypothetical protein
MGYVEPDFALLQMNLATLAVQQHRCIGARRQIELAAIGQMAAQLLSMACMQRHLLRWLQPMPAAKHAGQARHTSYPQHGQRTTARLLHTRRMSRGQGHLALQGTALCRSPACHGRLRRLFVRRLPGTPAFQRLCATCAASVLAPCWRAISNKAYSSRLRSGISAFMTSPMQSQTARTTCFSMAASLIFICAAGLGMAEAIDAHQHKHLAALARHGLQAP